MARLSKEREAEIRACHSVGFSRGRIDEVFAELDAVRTERDAYKLLAQGRAELLAAYRTGGTPRESTFAKLDKAIDAIDAIEAALKTAPKAEKT